MGFAAPGQAASRRAAVRWLAAALLVTVLRRETAAQPTPVMSDPTLLVETVVSGLSSPTTMAFLAPGDILVLQKNDGQVRRVLNGVLQPLPVFDVAVNTDSERGLLGIAINTESPPKVFLYYTEASDPDGDGLPDGGAPLGNRVYRYTWNAAAARLENEQLVLDLPVSGGPNHDGGILVLGPTPTPGPSPPPGDGSPLFAVIGDLNHGGQLENVAGGGAPDDTAVILRVDQSGAPWPGNPFVPYCSGTTSQTCPTGSGCPAGQNCVTSVARYFAYGVRNSFGMALDPVTGALWDTENGAGSYDEINLVAPGFNSGWLPIMGPDGRDPQGIGDLFAMPGGASAYSDPEFSWLTPIAVTGIAFPIGGALGPFYDTVALVGDFNFGSLYQLKLTPQRTGFDFSDVPGISDLVADDAAERDLLRIGSGFGGISDVKRGPDGAIYVVSIGHGAIYRVRAVNPPTPTPTLTPTATPYALTGAVRYYIGGRPVAGVSLAIEGAATLGTTTDAGGAFLAAPLPMGDWRLTPRKSGSLNNGLSALDGTRVLQFVAGLRPFAPIQIAICDVTGDGTCSALDATRILQREAGIISTFDAAVACQSDWLFFPAASVVPNQTLTQPSISNGMCVLASIAYQPLTNSFANQDFIAAVRGDLTGNWMP